MTQEEKQLLLKDLCGRLPYRPLVQDEDAGVCLLQTYMVNDLMFKNPSLSIKPYLRPMSSMTEEEKEEFCYLQDMVIYNTKGPVTADVNTYVDWLLLHHFDFRGLNKMGLALEAPKEMYKTE